MQQVTDNRRPAGASLPTDVPDAVATVPSHQVTDAADVLVDGSGRLGLLSYLIPPDMTVAPGDAVQVPFGARTRHGLVVGAATNPQKATKAITAVHGKRCDPHDIALARNVAKFHFADLAQVLTRLAPKSGRGAEPIVDGEVRLSVEPIAVPDSPASRRLLVYAPLVDAATLAAQEAHRIAQAHPGGQVLVLCPTIERVADVNEAFECGGQRLDSKARRGAWKGFSTGTVAVGIGTRAAALYSAANLAGIVVLDEDHPGHLEATQPHTHARDLASARARALGIDLTLISATPTPAALGAGVAVFAVGTKTDWPKMRVVDRGTVDPVSRWTPGPLLAAVRSENKNARTPVVVVQRKAAVRRCVRCAEVRPCHLCDSSLCRHNDTTPCPRCAATAGVRMTGWDASRVEAALAGHTVKVVTVADLPSVHDAGLVVLFDVDAALAVPELIADQFANTLIVSAARAAGRDGTLMALTDTPDSAILTDLFGPRDQLAVARRTFASARAANLPPFGRLVRILSGQAAAPRVAGWPGTVHGPRKVGTEWELLVRIPAEQVLELERPIARLRARGKVRLTVA